MWFQCLFVSIFVAASYGASVRIVNGTDATEAEFPFAVSLRRNNRLTCGATILNSKFILTAAHCVCAGSQKPMDKSMFNIQYGLTKITDVPVNIRQIAQITCNQYQPTTLTYDVAVLELTQPLPNDNSWKAVTLAQNYNSLRAQDGVVIGWGRLKENGSLPSNLQKLSVNIYNDALCAKNFDIKHHICFGAPNGGACNGDSGTALLANGQQIGVASFINNVCGVANETYPNVYARVDSYYGWIKNIAGTIN